MTRDDPDLAALSPEPELASSSVRIIAISFAAALICLPPGLQPALAAGATVPDFGPGGAIVMLILHGAFYLLVFAVLPAAAIYAGHRLVTGTRLRRPVMAALKSRYLYSVAALVAWIVFVAFATGGFSSRQLSGLRDWSIFAGLGIVWFVLPLFVMALFQREKTGFGSFARVAAVAVIGVLTSSVVYTSVEKQSADRAHALLEAAAASIYEFEATRGETPRQLDELPGNLRLGYLCRNIQFMPDERKLALDIYVTENKSLMYRLSFGCLGRFSRGETITRASLELNPPANTGLVGPTE